MMRFSQSTSVAERFNMDWQPTHDPSKQLAVHPAWEELEMNTCIEQNGSLVETPVPHTLMSEMLS